MLGCLDPVSPKMARCRCRQQDQLPSSLIVQRCRPLYHYGARVMLPSRDCCASYVNACVGGTEFGCVDRCQRSTASSAIA